MLTSPARPLILACGMAIALFDLVALLPGNPDVTGTPSFLILVAIQLLIIWRLLQRSLIAWSLAALAWGSYPVGFVLVGAPYETTFTISAVLALLQVAFLFTPPVLAYVFSEQDGAASHRTGG